MFNNNSNANWVYHYDGASRVDWATGADASGTATRWDYGYDGAGNRTEIKQTNTSTGTVTSDLTTNYNASGLSTTASDSKTGETIGYTFDPADEHQGRLVEQRQQLGLRLQRVGPDDLRKGSVYNLHIGRYSYRSDLRCVGPRGVLHIQRHNDDQ